MSVSSHMPSIGTRLSIIRQSQGYSQRKVAELAGLTHSAVSSVEQDKVSPSISTLHKILAVYHISLADFFAEEEQKCPASIIIEAEDLVQWESQGVTLQLLRSKEGAESLGMMIETYAPGSSTGEQLTHEGEEVGTVLEGSIEILYDGQTYLLGPGQSYAINTNIPHTFRNPGHVPCKLISANTPLTL